MSHYLVCVKFCGRVETPAGVGGRNIRLGTTLTGVGVRNLSRGLIQAEVGAEIFGRVGYAKVGVIFFCGSHTSSGVGDIKSSWSHAMAGVGLAQNCRGQTLALGRSSF